MTVKLLQHLNRYLISRKVAECMTGDVHSELLLDPSGWRYMVPQKLINSTSCESNSTLHSKLIIQVFELF